MSRARNIKPGFFKNEDLAECSSWARLCFIGLWTLADREGRLEDRAKRIKAELFAYDSVEVEPLLADLATHGFILRFKDGAGLGIIQVIEFSKHQSPHFKEAKSILASPQSLGLLKQQYEDKASGKPDISPGFYGDERTIDDASAPPDSLIPDSLIPDSLNPESLQKKEPAALVAEASPSTPYRVPNCPTEELIALYHQHLPALPVVEVMNDGRKRSLSARWRDVCGDGKFDKAAGLDWFSWFFERVAGSDFLMGRTAGKSGQHWRADFDFLTTPSKFVKVVEGRYHQGATA
jgi:hypothetical protein